MFSYILVVFTGYIPLISIFPMLKTGKLYSRYLQTYLRITLRVQKCDGLLNCTKIPLIFVCWKSQQSTL